MSNIPQAKGQAFIIAAPSGAGKTSLVAALLNQLDDIQVSISHTTRPQRKGEQDGVNYHFVNPSQFQQLIHEDAFLEYAEVFGHYYGTSQPWVESQLNKGTDIIFEIDWQGARQLRLQMPDVLSIFILPPSFAILEQRLTNRASDKPEVIQRRLQQARSDMAHYQDFDYVVINDDFNQALFELKAIVTSQRLNTQRQLQKQQHMLEDLLKGD